MASGNDSAMRRRFHETDSIRLHVNKQGQWIGTFNGPHGADVKRLFGTRHLPTPFTNATPGDVVLARVKELNPGVEVTLGH